jgi:hypothetical protein
MGKKNYNAIENNPQNLGPVLNHFEYLNLKNLGEFRASRVISTLVDGMIQHRNHKDEVTPSNVTYLPLSLGYRPA